MGDGFVIYSAAPLDVLAAPMLDYLAILYLLLYCPKSSLFEKFFNCIVL